VVSRFVRRFMFQTIHDVALMLDRERVGREASPTGGVIDSQSIKAPEAKTRGYDAGKKIVGRKRHIAVDTDGRLLMVNLTTADISDSAGAQMILDNVRKRWPWPFAGSLYSLDADLSCRRMAEAIGISNGPAWSPDDRIFYFADSRRRLIYAYDFDLATGAIANRRVFADCSHEPFEPDGATIDEEGCLWSAQWNGWRIVRYTPDGGVDRIVEMPVQRPTSCMFGGPNLGTLYVTSARIGLTDEELAAQPQAGGVFALDVGVRGLPAFRFAG